MIAGLAVRVLGGFACATPSFEGAGFETVVVVFQGCLGT